jgi:hypothetical protein
MFTALLSLAALIAIRWRTTRPSRTLMLSETAAL